MNPARFALQKKTVILTLCTMLTLGGIYGYLHIGRLENPDFVIKTALIMVPFPGASADEVERLVTDRIEEQIKTMSQQKEIRSTSKPGLSVVYADMKDKYNSKSLPQIWDELRKKMRDIAPIIQREGAGPIIVEDDFSDVYGLMYSLSTDDPNISKNDLRDCAEELKAELVDCLDVSKIDFWGIEQDAIYLRFTPTQLEGYKGLRNTLLKRISEENLIRDAGHIQIGDDYIRIHPTGDLDNLENIRNIQLNDYAGKTGVRLGEICEVVREPVTPQHQIMRYGGHRAVAMGVSTIPGGNAVVMGNDVKKRLKEILPELRKRPKSKFRKGNVQVDIVYDQSQIVEDAVGGFVDNLAMSIAVVIGILLLFMGWRSGMLIGITLVLTILATLLVMYLTGITLQKVSLGALILALGMLVDNAIVIVEGALIRIQKGIDHHQAAIESTVKTQWPLLGATFIAILAFAAIGFAPGNVGEFCQSLFYVLAIALLWSWIFAVTLTPILCVWILKVPKVVKDDPYDTRFFSLFRWFLDKILRFWPATLGVLGLMLCVAGVAFNNLPESFFPRSTQKYFYINLWGPEGTHIDVTSEKMRKIEQEVMKINDVKAVSTFIGSGTLRFMLSYDVEPPGSCFGQLLCEVTDHEKIDAIKATVNTKLDKLQMRAGNEVRFFHFPNGPPLKYGVEARFIGSDHATLKKFADRAVKIFEKQGARDVRTDWRQPINVIHLKLDQQKLGEYGISRENVCASLQSSFEGVPIAPFREGIYTIPVKLQIRSPNPEKRVPAGGVALPGPIREARNSLTDVAVPLGRGQNALEQLRAIRIYSSTQAISYPLTDLLVGGEINNDWLEQEYPLRQRHNRRCAVTVQGNPPLGELNSWMQAKVLTEIEELAKEMPMGYKLEWRGEKYASSQGTEPLYKAFQICLLLMFVTLICLFDAIRQPIIIFLCLPLALIGVAPTLFTLQISFGFFSILGFLGLSGMLIKNAIVLIDEIDYERSTGESPYQAIIGSAVSRLRPVCMASGTTVLGMMPLMTSLFYQGMAATIVGGLIAATLLTLLVVPLFYKLFFWIKPDKR